VTVDVRLPTVLRQHAGGQATIAADGETLGELFADLVARFPSIKSSLLGDDGQLHRFVNVYVNDDDVRYLDKLDTKVGPGDTVSILPAVAGG
jgi:sulfur-carrier protein